jgi:hypothetical protein
MSDAVPLFLYTGVTCECFQIYGSCPHCNDWLNNNVRRETRHIKHEGRIIIHPSEKCDIFNKYFADISNIENEPNLPNEDFARDDICPDLLITEQEVKDQLEILNNSKPSGPDGVAPRILRSVSQCLVSPLTLLFNQSLQCDNFHIFGVNK